MNAFLETEVPQGLRDRLAFAFLNTDPPAHHRLCHAHRVLNLPFLALYRDGVLVYTVTGMNKKEILRRLKDLASGPS